MHLCLKQVGNEIEISLDQEPLLVVDRAFLKSGIGPRIESGIGSGIESWSVASKEEFFALFYPLERRVALSVAMQKLSRQALHSKKLALYLKGRHFSPQAIDYALEELRRLGALDDQEVVGQLTARLKARNKSSRYIALKCQQAGAKPEEYSSLMEGEKERLLRLIQKRYPILLREDATFLERQKAKNALFRQGFSPEVIACALNDE